MKTLDNLLIDSSDRGFAQTMIMSLFRKDPTRETAETLYSGAVDQARRPAFYAEFGVPDTVEGRFELIALNVWLILRTLKGQGDAAQKMSQAVFDVMFENMDHSLRELGVGDLAISRKVRTLAENFYGRLSAYEKALTEEAAPEDLVAALGRNVFENEEAPGARELADYVRRATVDSEANPLAEIFAGRFVYPAPETGDE